MLKDQDEGGLQGPGSYDACYGCGGRIKDRFFLLAVDEQWHSGCLKCCECKTPLGPDGTCFVKESNIYCKKDYYRLFASKRCARCQAAISAHELVMRARDLVYHVGCFRCAHCERPLSRGDHFGMRDSLVFCRVHYEELQVFAPHSDLNHPLHSMSSGGECCGEEEEMSDFTAAGHTVAADLPIGSPSRTGFFNGSTGGQKGRPRKRKSQDADLQSVGLRIPPVLAFCSFPSEMLHPGELAGPLEQLAFDSSSASSPGNPGTGSGGHQQSGQRTKRMRTSFKHHQLRTMKSYFAINQNPDAKDLKQLAQKTGLSKRVLQVWFQNARAKWRRNMMRQENHQQPQPPPQIDPNSLGPSSVSSQPLDLGPQPQLVDDNSVGSHPALAFGELY
ncbi:LIM/homeobox protein Lhx9-like isoform X2 [Neocloeon triangulifer]|uniref:LIM/homeobox protein Lhx9-like isoform X2 n=1 Tax=Neocloeon triangulifer TaxID=2078957 RepID=UPI00286F306B|nr:LIM/homeobox protein Lhx9-like isoform X2 [Neocloeon triangulifer]